jgi:hypothetical protein
LANVEAKTAQKIKTLGTVRPISKVLTIKKEKHHAPQF